MRIDKVVGIYSTVENERVAIKVYESCRTVSCVVNFINEKDN